MKPTLVYLLDNQRRRVKATLRDLQPSSDLDQWVKLWKPRLSNTSQRDRRWDWVKKYVKLDTANFEHYAIECKGRLQGMVILETDFHRTREGNLPLVYVEYLATAPWNRPTLERLPKFRLVGRLLIHRAVARSHELGYHHRTGLHALHGSEEFYRDKIVMRDFGPDPSEGNLHYFEFGEREGRDFLKG